MRLARLDAAARLILCDPELARDAVQEALIRTWRDLPGLRDPDRLDAWLHRLTVNACFDLIRRRKRRVIEVELIAIDSPATHDVAGALADREHRPTCLGRLGYRSDQDLVTGRLACAHAGRNALEVFSIDPVTCEFELLDWDAANLPDWQRSGL